MGDNKNMLPHDQHKTVATVSFSLKQHVLNERSADKRCKRFKGMHRIIQYALLQIDYIYLAVIKAQTTVTSLFSLGTKW